MSKTILIGLLVQSWCCPTKRGNTKSAVKLLSKSNCLQIATRLCLSNCSTYLLKPFLTCVQSTELCLFSSRINCLWCSIDHDWEHWNQLVQAGNLQLRTPMWGVWYQRMCLDVPCINWGWNYYKGIIWNNAGVNKFTFSRPSDKRPNAIESKQVYNIHTKTLQTSRRLQNSCSR